MHDRTRTAVIRQIKGMDANLYEIGVRHPERGMLNREWTKDEIIKSLDWLKRENVNGCDIYIRPARSAPSRLILIDDLKIGALTKLQDGPYSAAVTVQTSPNNYQAWVKLNGDAPADIRREAARHLAREYGGDPNSADSAHYGRLAGFTNRKPQHIDKTGKSPWVLLDSYNGKPANGAGELVQIAQQVTEKQTRAFNINIQKKTENIPYSSKELSTWYRDLWCSLQKQFDDNFDASRADWMAAVAMFHKGYNSQTVTDTILKYSPDIEDRKGKAAADYAARTASKAEIWYELKKQGVSYDDVSDALLLLSKQQPKKTTNHER
jgi:hypothetical protein